MGRTSARAPWATLLFFLCFLFITVGRPFVLWTLILVLLDVFYALRAKWKDCALFCPAAVKGYGQNMYKNSRPSARLTTLRSGNSSSCSVNICLGLNSAMGGSVVKCVRPLWWLFMHFKCKLLRLSAPNCQLKLNWPAHWQVAPRPGTVESD